MECVSSIETIWIGSRVTAEMNLGWKGKLESWLNDGLSEVTRHCEKDACEACRDLADPGMNVFKIEHLLELEDPLNQDPNSGRPICSGSCRCSFKPMVGRKFLDDV